MGRRKGQASLGCPGNPGVPFPSGKRRENLRNGQRFRCPAIKSSSRKVFAIVIALTPVLS